MELARPGFGGAVSHPETKMVLRGTGEGSERRLTRPQNRSLDPSTWRLYQVEGGKDSLFAQEAEGDCPGSRSPNSMLTDKRGAKAILPQPPPACKDASHAICETRPVRLAEAPRPGSDPPPLGGSRGSDDRAWRHRPGLGRHRDLR